MIKYIHEIDINEKDCQYSYEYYLEDCEKDGKEPYDFYTWVKYALNRWGVEEVCSYSKSHRRIEIVEEEGD